MATKGYSFQDDIDNDMNIVVEKEKMNEWKKWVFLK